ncbi:MAG TPA: hypothetical protein VI653_13550, partial [Steroidobacteraceae bacterium]
RMAVIDAVRRAPVVSHRQLGAFSLRDLEIATGQLKPTEPNAKAPSREQIDATLTATPEEELAAISGALQAGIGSLRTIVATMQARGGADSAPDFDGLLRPLSRIEKFLSEHLKSSIVSAPVAAPLGKDNTGMSTGSVMDIRSPEDALRALDAVVEFFRVHEPSSPVPIFVERAKRLVSKSFMEVLEDIVPDSVSQAKLIGGIRGDRGR